MSFILWRPEKDGVKHEALLPPRSKFLWSVTQMYRPIFLRLKWANRGDWIPASEEHEILWMVMKPPTATRFSFHCDLSEHESDDSKVPKGRYGPDASWEKSGGLKSLTVMQDLAVLVLSGGLPSTRADDPSHAYMRRHPTEGCFHPW